MIRKFLTPPLLHVLICHSDVAGPVQFPGPKSTSGTFFFNPGTPLNNDVDVYVDIISTGENVRHVSYLSVRAVLGLKLMLLSLLVLVPGVVMPTAV